MGRPGPDFVKICQRCGIEYHPTSTRQQCCNKPIQIPCAICGKPMDRICTLAAQKETCSKECNNELIKRRQAESAHKLTKKCKFCGKEFIPNSYMNQYCNYPHYINCEVCGKQFEIDPSTNYPKTCSNACRYIAASQNKDIEAMKANLKATMLERYGVENAMDIPEARAKIQETMKERYGGAYTSTAEYKERVRQTCLAKYGIGHWLQSEEIKNKRKQTIKEKYGVDNVFKSEEIKKKSRQSVLSKYGVEYISQSPEIHRKQSLNRKNNVAIDGKIFDSSYECRFYDFLLRLGYQDTIQTQVPISFEYEGKSHVLLIDFKVGNLLFEVKGAHLLDGVFDHKQIIPIDVKLDIYRKNHVIIITDKTDKVDSIFGRPESKLSNGLRYLDKCPYPLIGIDIDLFSDKPTFPYAFDKPKCFYDVKVDGNRSSYDTFYDPAMRWKMIINRIEYVGGFIDNKQILTAMNVTRTGKQPSWFSTEYAVNLINKYCSTNIIVDPFAGWGTRCDAARYLGKQYIGVDLNPDLVQWHKSLGRPIELGDAKSFEYDDECSVFICPPYGNKEIYFDGQDTELSECQWLDIVMKNIPNAKEYIMVCKQVDSGWEQYVVETKENRSHLGKNTESVILIRNDNSR